MSDRQGIDGHDVVLERLGGWIQERVNARYPSAIEAIATSPGILATTFKYRTLNLYRRRSSGPSLERCQIRIQYITQDSPDRQSGDANFRTLSKAIAQCLCDWGLLQNEIPPLQIDTSSLVCDQRFPVLQIDFDAEDLSELQQ